MVCNALTAKIPSSSPWPGCIARLRDAGHEPGDARRDMGDAENLISVRTVE